MKNTKQLFFCLALAISIASLPKSAFAEKKINMKKEIQKMCKELGGDFWVDGDEYGCSLDDTEEIHCFMYIDECELFVDGTVYNPNPLKKKKIRKLKKLFGVKSVGSTQDLYAKFPELEQKKKKRKTKKTTSKFGLFKLVTPNN